MLFSAIWDAYGSMTPPAQAEISCRSWFNRQEGFTLNEILISIALIAIGVIGFSVNTIGVIQGNYTSGNFTIATNLAQDKLEALKVASSFTAVTNSADSNNPITETGASGGRFTRTWTIAASSLDDTTTLAATGTTLWEISVTVSWSEYGVSRQVEERTLVFQEAS